MLQGGIIFVLVSSAECFEQGYIFWKMGRRADVHGDCKAILWAAYRVSVVLSLDEMLDAMVAISVPAHGQKTWRVAFRIMVGADWAFELLHY